MPSKNVVKLYSEDTFYHVFNRGVNKQDIFIDQQDYIVFTGILKRYLSKETQADSAGRDYPNHKELIDVVAYCLMPNHYHLLLYQKDNKVGMTNLMRAVCTAYTMYFNKKHKRVGHLFQGPFKAVGIDSDSQLLHITRYIHMNPRDYLKWPYSSLREYAGEKPSDWLEPKVILELFSGDSKEYMAFLGNYQEEKHELQILKNDLAGY